MIELRSSSADQTRAIASAVAGMARPGDLIVLAGQMGAGKTAFAQGFARALGVHEPVTSPTFTIVHTYETGSTTLHHADLYRLEHTTEVADLALDELVDDDAIVIVEWGDVVDLGAHLQIELRAEDDDDNARTVVVTSSDKRWALRWERLEAALVDWTVS
jgi:tRNA threonylcarbamoyladenosine biosynthesis protein TsaE